MKGVKTMAARPKKDAASATRKAAKSDSALDRLAEEAEFMSREGREEAAVRVVQPGRLNHLPESELGDRIQEIREGKRLTQGELAELTKSIDPEEKGISRAVISLYEAGKNRPSPREMRLLCEALRITPNFLIYGDEHPFDPLRDEERLGSRSRSDPEGFAWMAYVFATLHHNHFDAIMTLALDLQRGWNKSYDQGMQEKANERLLAMAEDLRSRLELRSALKEN
jgi:transcriptional regulator with XRE-family HTH domain